MPRKKRSLRKKYIRVWREARVTLNQHYHAQAACHGDEIKNQAHKEEVCLQMEPHQNEFCHHSAILCHESLLIH